MSPKNRQTLRDIFWEITPRLSSKQLTVTSCCHGLNVYVQPFGVSPAPPAKKIGLNTGCVYRCTNFHQCTRSYRPNLPMSKLNRLYYHSSWVPYHPRIPSPNSKWCELHTLERIPHRSSLKPQTLRSTLVYSCAFRCVLVRVLSL